MTGSCLPREAPALEQDYALSIISNCLVFGNRYRKGRPSWELLLPVCAPEKGCPFWGEAAKILGNGGAEWPVTLWV